MYTNDYMIVMTEDGPVLCHGLFNRNKNKEKKNRKYIQKIVDGGKTLYFYSKDQLDNFYKNSGLKARVDLGKARRQWKKDTREGNYWKSRWLDEGNVLAKDIAYMRTPLGKLETKLSNWKIDLQKELSRKINEIDFKISRNRFKRTIRRESKRTLREIDRFLDDLIDGDLFDDYD